MLAGENGKSGEFKGQWGRPVLLQRGGRRMLVVADA
jgi:hypothetical protein